MDICHRIRDRLKLNFFFSLHNFHSMLIELLIDL